MKLVAKLPYYAFIGWAGLLTIGVLIAQNWLELAAVAGWCLIASSILGFYLFTIEAPKVECEWAGWILSPALVLIVFTGVEPLTQILWLVSVLALAYTGLMYAAERNPDLYEKLPRYLRPFRFGPEKADNSITEPIVLK